MNRYCIGTTANKARKRVKNMEYRKFLDKKISLLGLGCMRFPLIDIESKQIDEAAAQEMVDYAISHGVNYFDTAWTYHNSTSETFMGNALKKHPRHGFMLATKMPTWLVKTKEDVERIFNQQLINCQVDYFDNYLMHNYTTEHMEICETIGVYELLKQKQSEGKIKNLGVSIHDTVDGIETIVSLHHWDFVQIQLNYIDWELLQAKRTYEYLKERNIPMIIMEPVRGGTLAKLSEESSTLLKQANEKASIASWAIRYAAQKEGVITVLSGMSTMQQLKDNISTMDPFLPLNEKEEELLLLVAKEYRASGAVPCTACGYCMPCPAGVDIPRVFGIYNEYKASGHIVQFGVGNFMMGEEKQAKNCVACGQCERECPQRIHVSAEMKKIAEQIRALDN